MEYQIAVPCKRSVHCHRECWVLVVRAIIIRWYCWWTGWPERAGPCRYCRNPVWVWVLRRHHGLCCPEATSLELPGILCHLTISCCQLFIIEWNHCGPTMLHASEASILEVTEKTSTGVEVLAAVRAKRTSDVAVVITLSMYDCAVSPPHASCCQNLATIIANETSSSFGSICLHKGRGWHPRLLSQRSELSLPNPMPEVLHLSCMCSVFHSLDQ
eukprot:3107859-Pyramimonas_sp.AAC.2